MKKIFVFASLFLMILILISSCKAKIVEDEKLIVTIEIFGDIGGEIVGAGEYVEGSLVEIVAVPNSRYRFSHWEGDITGETIKQIIVIEEDINITAHFELNEIDRYTYENDEFVFSMRRLPNGTFPIQRYDDDQKTVDNSFWISETQVTYELWYHVKNWAENEGYEFANNGREGSDGSSGQFPSAKKLEPVTNISWRDAIVWLNALSEKLELDPVYLYQGNVVKDAKNVVACENAEQSNSNGFRMPTEWEWELAARFLGENQPNQEPLKNQAIEINGYWWTPGVYASGAYDSYLNDEESKAVCWFMKNTSNKTEEVAMLRSNHIGVFDMSGNVREWTFSKRGNYWISRGGGWSDAGTDISVSAFFDDFSWGTSGFLGIRIAKNEN